MEITDLATLYAYGILDNGGTKSFCDAARGSGLWFSVLMHFLLKQEVKDGMC